MATAHAFGAGRPARVVNPAPGYTTPSPAFLPHRPQRHLGPAPHNGTGRSHQTQAGRGSGIKEGQLAAQADTATRAAPPEPRLTPHEVASDTLHAVAAGT